MWKILLLVVMKNSLDGEVVVGLILRDLGQRFLQECSYPFGLVLLRSGLLFLLYVYYISFESSSLGAFSAVITASYDFLFIVQCRLCTKEDLLHFMIIFLGSFSHIGELTLSNQVGA